MQSLEHAEQLAHEPHIEADTIVLDDVDSLAVLDLTGDVNDRVCGRALCLIALSRRLVNMRSIMPGSA